MIIACGPRTRTISANFPVVALGPLLNKHQSIPGPARDSGGGSAEDNGTASAVSAQCWIKVQELFVVPQAADRTFFYGINFEFSHHAKRIDGRELDLIE